MAHYDNDWDRERDEDRRRREQRARTDYERRPPDIGRSNEYGSHAGWGGQGFNQGSFGHYGSQGERLYNQSIGQGYGAGMSSWNEPGRPASPGGNQTWNSRDYASEDRERRRYDERNERWDDRQADWGRDHDQQQWRDRDREHQNYGARESGWGGYGAYDRERRYETRDYDSTWDSARGRGEEWNRPNSQGWAGQQNRGWTANRTDETARRGQHFGRGPKGWTRSDDRIREDINERLTDHPDVDASDIDVEVKNGEVTLKGSVDDRRAKRLAEDIAEGVSGVRDVQNQIRVHRGFWGSVKDTFTGENQQSDQQTSAPVHTITPGPETRNQPVTTTTARK